MTLEIQDMFCGTSSNLVMEDFCGQNWEQLCIVQTFRLGTQNLQEKNK